MAIGYGQAHSTAKTIVDNTTIVANGAVDITSYAGTEVFVKARTSSNLTGTPDPKNISLAIAIANTSETSHVTVSDLSSIISNHDSVNVDAAGEVTNFAWSQPTIYVDGTTATAFSFGFDEADIKTRVDGTIDAAGGVGNTFDAREGGDVDYGANTISIPDHGFTDGQEVRYSHGETNAPLGKVEPPNIGGLEDFSENDEAIYYVQVIDENTIQLAKASTIDLGTRNLHLGVEPEHTLGKLDSIEFDSSGVNTDESSETITFANPHGLQDDQAVTYLGAYRNPDQDGNEQNADVAGLETGKPYYVITVADNDSAIRLAESPGGAALDLTDAGAGRHAFLYESKTAKFSPENAVDDETNTITCAAHGLSTGDAVIYYTDPTVTRENTLGDETVAELDAPVDGLSDGSVYFVVKVDDDTLRLTSSKKAAIDAAAVDLQQATAMPGVGLGDAHRLTSSSASDGISVHAGLDATNTINANATITGEPFSWTNIGDADRMVQPEEIFGVIGNLTQLAKKALGKQPAKSPTQAGADFGIAGSIGINYADHDVQAIIGATGSLTSSQDIGVLGEIRQASQVMSVSDAAKPEEAEAEASVAVAVGLGIFNNTAKATVEGGAKLDAGGTIAVDAGVDYGFLIANPWTAVNPKDFLKQTGPAGFGYMNDGTLGYASNLFNTWVMTSASQSKVAAGGSFAINIYNNAAEARIKNGAMVNRKTDPKFRTGDQTVGVDAAIDMNLIGVAGVGGLGLTVENLALKPIKSLFTKDKPFESLQELVNPFGAGGDKGGIGASFLVEVMNNTTEAVIEDGVMVHAGWLRTFDPNANGVIDDHNWITLSDAFDLPTGTALIYHADPNGTTIGDLVDGQTYYVIGDEQNANRIKLATSEADATNGTAMELQPGAVGGQHSLVKANGAGLTISAGTNVFDLALSQAGSKASSFAVAGAFSVGVFNHTTKAHIDSGAMIDTAGAITVSAIDDLTRIGVAGGVVAGANIGIGVSVSVNVIDRNTQAFIGTGFDPSNPLDPSVDTGTKVTAAGPITVDAKSTGALWTTSVAAAVTGKAPTENELVDNERIRNAPAKAKKVLGETGQTHQLKVGVGIAGDVSVNVLDEETYAYINDTGTITTDGTLRLLSTGDTAIWSLAGSVAISLKGGKTSAGIAGSISTNVVTGDTKSFIVGAALDAASLSLLAERKGGIRSLTAAGSGAPLKQGIAVAGSISANVVLDTVEAYLTGATATFAESSSIRAENECQIWAIGGAARTGARPEWAWLSP